MRTLNFFMPLLVATTVMVIQPAAGNAESCADIAISVADDYGGELLSVTTVDDNGLAACKITILIRSNDGGPARKTTVIVPKQ